MAVEHRILTSVAVPGLKPRQSWELSRLPWPASSVSTSLLAKHAIGWTGGTLRLVGGAREKWIRAGGTSGYSIEPQVGGIQPGVE